METPTSIESLQNAVRATGHVSFSNLLRELEMAAANISKLTLSTVYL